MNFRFTVAGGEGRDSIESEILKQIQNVEEGSAVVWFTYSFRPTLTLLRAFEEKNLLVRVLLVHDPEATRGVTVSNRAWSDFQEHTGERGELFQWVSTRDRNFHAKAVFLVPNLRATSVPTAIALGSFNFTDQGLTRSIETIGWVDARDQRRELWQQAWKLLNNRDHVKSVVWEEQGDEPPHPRNRSAALLTVEELERFKVTLDGMMADWPDNHPAARGYQSDVYNKLDGRWKKTGSLGDLRSELLYLPVGSGKTFIALRWMVQRLLETGGARRGLYLVPNRWVARTVNDDLERVINQASLNVQRALASFDVSVPSDVDSASTPACLVADECHRWRPSDHESLSVSYSGVIDDLRGKSVATLGVTATPCRMDRGRFRVDTFVSSFLGREVYGHKPDLTLTEALNKKLIVPPKFARLAPDRQKEIEKVLGTNSAEIVNFGDYGRVTLSNVWAILCRDVDKLVRAIVSGVEGRRRIVVFLPPVGVAADAFVSRLEAAVLARWRKAFWCDFRSSTDEDRGQSRRDFRSFVEYQADHERPAFLVTIDRFAEGVSIPTIDAIVMLRATLSLRVAMQSLGRGLRRSPGKSDCLVLDAVQFWESLNRHEALPSRLAPGQLSSSLTDEFREREPATGTRVDAKILHREVINQFRALGCKFVSESDSNMSFVISRSGHEVVALKLYASVVRARLLTRSVIGEVPRWEGFSVTTGGLYYHDSGFCRINSLEAARNFVTYVAGEWPEYFASHPAISPTEQSDRAEPCRVSNCLYASVYGTHGEWQNSEEGLELIGHLRRLIQKGQLGQGYLMMSTRGMIRVTYPNTAVQINVLEWSPDGWTCTNNVPRTLQAMRRKNSELFAEKLLEWVNDCRDAPV